MIHAGLATTRDFIKGNPDKVRRYVQAYIEATKSPAPMPRPPSKSSPNRPRPKTKKTSTKLTTPM